LETAALKLASNLKIVNTSRSISVKGLKAGQGTSSK
jgi:hypothetical protein